MAQNPLDWFNPGVTTTPPPGLTPATSNMTWYVSSSTGNDANAGTANAPFATIQQAVNTAASYDYQNLYTCNLIVADGTYAVNGSAPAVTLLPLTHHPLSPNPTITGDTATPANCIISNTSGDALAIGRYAIWTVLGFRLKSTSGTGSDLNAYTCSSSTIGHIDFAGSGILLNVGVGAYVDTGAPGQGSGGYPITSSTTSAVNAVNASIYAKFINDGSTWTFNNSPTFSSQITYLADYSMLGAGAWSGTVTGNILNAFNIIQVEINRSALPGSGAFTEAGIIAYYDQIRLTPAAGEVYLNLAGNVDGSSGLVIDLGGSSINSATPVEIVVPNSGSQKIWGAVRQTDWNVDGGSGYDFMQAGYNIGGTALAGIGFGAGSAARDVDIHRSAAGVLTVGNAGGSGGLGSLKAADLYTSDATFLMRASTTLSNGSGASSATLTNAPASGNPTKWVGIDDNGTTRYFPTWT